MPRAGESQAIAFYSGVLGLEPVEKPPQLAERGGVWFALGEVRVHLGVEEPFRPALKAHPAFRVRSIDAMLDRLRSNGIDVNRDIDLPGIVRVYASDAFGNRIEFLEETA